MDVGALEVSRELPPQFRLVSMITYFADVKFCRSLFINFARPSVLSFGNITKKIVSSCLSQENYSKLGSNNSIQNRKKKNCNINICLGIKILEDNFPLWRPPLPSSNITADVLLASSPLLAIYCWAKTAHISFLPLPLSLRFLLKLENISQNF